jgi:hypothetical protein
LVPTAATFLKKPGPSILADALVLAYPTKRYQSAWITLVI